MFRRIMAALDDSDEANRAFLVALELARALKAELKIITILEPLPGYYSFAVFAAPGVDWLEEHRIQSLHIQASAIETAKSVGFVLESEVSEGNEVDGIVNAAKRYGSDLLVCGLRKHLVISGDTGRYIADRAPCALLGIP